MATLQAKDHPGSRIDAGETVLERAKLLDTKPIKARLASFGAAHGAYAKAERDVRAAEAAQLAKEAKAAQADVVQDAAVDALASAMAGERAPRTKPFSVLAAGAARFGAPSDIKAMAYDKEAALCLKLAAAAQKWKGGGKATKAAATALAKAATDVEKALQATPALEKKKSAAIKRRDALGQAWATAFEKLKNAARTAEDDGAVGLFDALFRDEPRPAPKPKAPAAPAPVANGGPPPPA